MAYVNVTAPYPLSLAPWAVFQERKRLRIVNKHYVCLLQDCPQFFGVGRDGFLKDLQERISDRDFFALQAIVETLCAFIEPPAAFNDFPPGIDPEFSLQGNQFIEDFRHPAADTSGVDVNDFHAPEWLSQLPEMFDDFLAGYWSIIEDRGHAALPLKKLAKALESCLRSSDRVTKYGSTPAKLLHNSSYSPSQFVNHARKSSSP